MTMSHLFGDVWSRPGLELVLHDHELPLPSPPPRRATLPGGARGKRLVMTKRIDVDKTIRELDAGKTPEWITDHLRLYRESGGAEGHLFDGSTVGEPGMLPCLLLTTIGRRSGQKRTSPLVYGTAGDACVVIGSKGGAETHPWWYLNLSVNPVVEVQVGKEIFSARARIATGSERAALWKQMVEAYPFYSKYQRKTRREIPVVVLEKQAKR